MDGAGFANTLFIAFDADPTLPDLLINFIPLGFSTPAECGLAAAPGQTCTLAGSPFNFHQCDCPFFDSDILVLW